MLLRQRRLASLVRAHLMSQVHVFIGSAAAGLTNRYSYPEGERHAVLVFSLKEDGTDFDWEEASFLASGRGWHNVVIERAGIVEPATLDDSSQQLVHAYNEALTDGRSMIVYTDPITP